MGGGFGFSVGISGGGVGGGFGFSAGEVQDRSAAFVDSSSPVAASFFSYPSIVRRNSSSKADAFSSLAPMSTNN